MTLGVGYGMIQIARKEAMSQVAFSMPRIRRPCWLLTPTGRGALIERHTMTLIPLGGKVAAGRCAIVDDDMADELLKHRWHYSDGYARRSVYCGRHGGKQKTRYIRMHREVWRLAGREIPAGHELDHINHDPLDNRIENLRVVTTAQNQYNQKPRAGGASRYKGVSWHKTTGKWMAYIMHNGKQIHLGLFADEIEAAQAYDAAARRLCGEYARCNFMEAGDCARSVGIL